MNLTEKKELATDQILATITKAFEKLSELAKDGYNARLTPHLMHYDIAPYSFNLTIEASYLKNGNSKITLECCFNDIPVRVYYCGDMPSRGDINKAFTAAFEYHHENADAAYARQERAFTGGGAG